MNDTTLQNEMLSIWEYLNNSLFVNLRTKFSNKDAEGWLSHFAPNQELSFHLYKKNVVGENGTVKIVRFYTGNKPSSTDSELMPGKPIANSILEELAKKNFSHSEVEILGMKKSNEENKITAFVRYRRYNTSGEEFESAISLYDLVKIGNDYYVYRMSIYDNNEETAQRVNLAEAWNPNK